MDTPANPTDLLTALLLEVDYGTADDAAHAVVAAKALPEALTYRVALSYRDRLNREGPPLAVARARAKAAARLAVLTEPDGA